MLYEVYHFQMRYCLPDAIVRHEGQEVEYKPSRCAERLIDLAALPDTIRIKL